MQTALDELIQKLTPWIVVHGIRILTIVILAFIIARVSRKFILKAITSTLVADKHQSALAQQKRRDTLYRIFSGVISLVIAAITLLMVLQEVGVPIIPILASAGVAGLAIGFGGQYLIRDIISGFFIILENQYRIGDIVSFDGTSGAVEDISLRMTTLRDMDGTVHHVPHGEIKKVANLSKYYARINLDMGISYSAPLERVIDIVNRVGNELAADKDFGAYVIKAPQFLRVEDFADSAVVIKILGETQPLKQWELSGELRKRLKLEFDKAGIEIPFPQVVVHRAGPNHEKNPVTD